jgi:hypothetical protein
LNCFGIDYMCIILWFKSPTAYWHSLSQLCVQLACWHDQFILHVTDSLFYTSAKPSHVSPLVFVWLNYYSWYIQMLGHPCYTTMCTSSWQLLVHHIWLSLFWPSMSW